MTSTATPLGFNKQGDGDNANTWGDVLNGQVIDLVDEAIRGIYAFALSGSHTLDATNFTSNEARRAILSITSGTGGTIIVPDVSKLYVVVNGASGDVTVKGSGAGCIVKAGETCQVVNDGSVVRRVQPTDYGAQRVTSVANPTSDQDAATKKYVDDTAFSAAGGTLPGQTGNAGKYITTDGAVASWKQVQTADIGDLATYNKGWLRRRLFASGSLIG
jgi:hypothetical protein